MRQALRAAVAGAVVAIAVAPAAEAADAQEGGQAQRQQVGKPPASVQQGATFKLAVRVANAKNRRASSGRVTVSLRPASGAKRSLNGGNLKTHEGRRPAHADALDHRAHHGPAPARYTLTACVRRGSGEGKASCRNAGTVTIIAKPSAPPRPAARAGARRGQRRRTSRPR